MPPQPEDTLEKAELFTGIEGIERGNALLEKLRELLPEEPIPENAWEYGEFGEIIAIEYLKNLTMEVAMVGGQTEEIHSQLYKLIEAEKKICRFPEKLREPNEGDFIELEQALDQITEEYITHLSQPINAETALKDILRKNTIRPAFTKIEKTIEKLLRDTRLCLNSNKDVHSNFWNLQYTKYNKIRILLGTQKDGQIVPDLAEDPLLKFMID